MKDERNTAPVIRFDGFTDAWELREFGELLNEVKRPIKISDNTEYKLVTVKRRNGGVVSRGIFKGKEILVKKYFELKAGDYLISKRQVVHGANGFVPYTLDGAVVSNEYLVSVGNENITTDFLTIISELPKMYKMFFLSSYGIDIEKLVFNIEDWKKRKMNLPSIDEQNRISSFFKQLNNSIALHQRKIEALQQMKKGFLQQMFPTNGETMPKIRFADFEEEWEQCKLKAVMKERNVQQPQTKEYPLVSFTVDKGVTPKTERYEREQLVVGDKATKKYKTTELNDIVYNPANLKFGAISRNRYGKAVFSPIYVTFVTNVELAYSIYIELFVTRQDFIQHSLRYQQGTVYERQSVSPEDLLNMILLLPNKEEQLRIGLFFQHLDKIINIHQNKLSQLKTLKKAYLQNMFT